MFKNKNIEGGSSRRAWLATRPAYIRACQNGNPLTKILITHEPLESTFSNFEYIFLRCLSSIWKSLKKIKNGVFEISAIKVFKRLFAWQINKFWQCYFYHSKAILISCKTRPSSPWSVQSNSKYLWFCLIKQPQFSDFLQPLSGRMSGTTIDIDLKFWMCVYNAQTHPHTKFQKNRMI